VNSLIQDMPKTCAAQKALTSATRAYTQALSGLVLAQATDTQQTQEQIRLQIGSITSDLNELTARYQALNTTPTGPAPVATNLSINDFQPFPAANNDSSGGSRWQELTMTQTIMSSSSAQSSAASASQTSTNVNLWFASYSSSSSNSSGSSSSTATSYYNDVTVALRATLVTVDRSGWFQPQFFKQSGAYYHINGGITWSKWPANVTTMSQLTKPDDTNWDTINKGLLPAYPVGYIICKDITIKIATGTSSDSSFKDNFSQQSAQSGGILCFSYSQSNSSSSSDNSHSFFSCSDGCVIRIPGPQILGYVMQLTENDTTTDMPASLPPNFFVPDSDYDAAIAGTGPANAPAPPAPTGTVTATNSELTSAVQNALQNANIPANSIDIGGLLTGIIEGLL